MKRVLLIGGSGYLGSYLLEELKAGEFEVFALVNRSSLADESGIKIIQGGLASISTSLIDEIMPDIIFHCARPVIPRFKKWGRIMAAQIAAKHNRNLIKNLSKSSSKPLLVFASGSLMYGSHREPRDENSPLQAISYARQYYKGEIPILKALEEHKYPIMLMRLPWLLGNGSWFKWFYLHWIEKAKAIPAFGDRNNLMEIIDVRDAANLILKYAREIATPGIYNIPSSGAISQQAFLNASSDVFNVPVKDYTEVIPGNIEKEALEAFTSNIILKTNHGDVLDEFRYTPLKKTLIEIKKSFNR
jgi:nucleoside-diphosphate-sugar epimerase